MSQNPGPWGQPPTPNQPPMPGQPQPGGQPQPHYPQQGFPQGGGSPQQGGPGGGYVPQNPVPQTGFPQQGFPQQGGFPQSGLGGGGYGQGPQGPHGFGPQPGGPAKKSGALIIGIVVAGLVLLVAVGGIILALTGKGSDQPTVTVTPNTQAPDPNPTTEEPDPNQTSEAPDPDPTSTEPKPDPTTTKADPDPPSADAVDLGNGVSLTPAFGWEVREKNKGIAQLSNGTEVYLGQAAKLEAGTNPGQLCTAWHKQIAEQFSSPKYSEPESIDLGSKKLKGANCSAQVTASTGQGTTEIMLFSVVSVRTDGLGVVGTAYFTKATDVETLNKDFTTMTNSMLKGQAG